MRHADVIAHKKERHEPWELFVFDFFLFELERNLRRFRFVRIVRLLEAFDEIRQFGHRFERVKRLRRISNRAKNKSISKRTNLYRQNLFFRTYILRTYFFERTRFDVKIISHQLRLRRMSSFAISCREASNSASMTAAFSFIFAVNCSMSSIRRFFA